MHTLFKSALVLCCAMVLGLFASCATPPTTDGSVKITALSFAPDKIPVQGTETTLTVEANYRTAPGSPALVKVGVQSASHSQDFIASVKERVLEGTGTVSLKVTFKVPPVESLYVFVPIYSSETRATAVVDLRVIPTGTSR